MEAAVRILADMNYLSGIATRWADDAFPGWVEVQIVDSDNTTVRLVDKVPVFGDNLNAETVYPVPVEVACSVLRTEHNQQDRELAVVRLVRGRARDRFGSDFCRGLNSSAALPYANSGCPPP